MDGELIVAAKTVDIYARRMTIVNPSQGECRQRNDLGRMHTVQGIERLIILTPQMIKISGRCRQGIGKRPLAVEALRFSKEG
jgi:hypothetical protein